MIKHQRGFTLAEALIAVVILAMIGLLTFGTLSRALSARQRTSDITQRHHQVRQALSRMSREISMAFLSRHKYCADPRTNTLFVGARASHGIRLDFTSFSHVKMLADAKESDQNGLSYFVDIDPKNRSLKHLMRREKKRIDEKPQAGGVTQVLAENIESLNMTFYDDKNDRWEDEWDTTRRDYKNRLPKYVSIELTAKDYLGKPLLFVTKTRIFTQIALLIPGANFIPCLD